MTRACLNCEATDLPDDARVCGYCGTPLSPMKTPDDPVPPPAPVQEQQPHTGRLRWVMVVLGVLAVGGVGAGLAVTLLGGEQPDASSAPATPAAQATAPVDEPTAASPSARATPTTESTAAAAPAEPLPPEVLQRLLGAEVLHHRWLADDDSDFHITPRPDGSMLAALDPPMEPGHAVVVTFVYAPQATFLAALERGTSGTDQLRSRGLRVPGDLAGVVAEVRDGDAEAADRHATAQGDLVPEADTPYNAILAVDHDGTLRLTMFDPFGDGFAQQQFDPSEAGTTASWRAEFSSESAGFELIEVWLVAFDRLT